MPPIPGLGRCCLCIKLPIGVLIIGYLELCGEIIMVLFFLAMLLFGAFKVLKSNDEKETRLAVIVVSLIMLTLMLVFFGFTGALISGVHQDRPLYVLMYLVIATLFMALSMIPLAFMMWNMDGKEVAIYGSIFLLDVYLLAVVWSYFLDLATPEDEDDEKDDDTEEEEDEMDLDV